MGIKHIIKLAIFLILSSTVFASGNEAISVTLQMNKESSSSSIINVLLKNNTTQTLKVLKWNTPLEDKLAANLFNVSVNDKRTTYTGILVKRGVPTESDYTIFAPGESRTVSIDLSNYYKMDQDGTYSVSYKGLIKFSLKESNANLKENTKKELKKIKPKSKVLNFEFIPIKKKTIAAKVTPNYNACTVDQIMTIDSAHDQSINISGVAFTDMNNAITPTSAPRYSTWFGPADITRHNTVKSNYLNIYSALDTQTVKFDCSCPAVADPANTYAYVYPNVPYEMYLCGAFWTAPLTGTDSQAGTLVHEMAHFTVVAGTDDHAYGQTAAQSLAISDPDLAVQNSDSHEYFAENTPYLTMDEVVSYTISGEIIDAATGLPISGAVVNLSGALSDVTTSGTDGSYIFTNLDAGSYTISATTDGYTTDSTSVTINTNNAVANLNLLSLTTSVDYKIVLSWGANPSDLDSHFFVADPSGNGCLDEVYYANQDVPPYASLDVDDTSSYGPETVSVTKIATTKSGEYWVNHYSSSPDFSISNATVKVYRGSTLIKTYNVPQDTGSKYWHVFDIGVGGITSINTLHDTKIGTCSRSSVGYMPSLINYLLN